MCVWCMHVSVQMCAHAPVCAVVRRGPWGSSSIALHCIALQHGLLLKQSLLLQLGWLAIERLGSACPVLQC